MSKRNDVLALLHVAGQSGAGCNITADLLAELCKAWIALDAAPEADGFHYSRPPMRAVTGVCFDGIDLIRFAGKRVRLVATSGGE